MKTEIITISKDGNSVEFIEGQSSLDLPLGKIRRRRVSVIQPTVWWKRLAFLSLRRVCGEQGRVAAFTRRWPGPWRCTILATGESEVFQDRADAIEWELETLRGPRFEL